MKLYNALVPTLLVLLMGSCGNNSAEKKDDFSLEIMGAKKTYTTKDVLSVSLNNKKNIAIDSVVYFINKDPGSIPGEATKTLAPSSPEASGLVRLRNKKRSLP